MITEQNVYPKSKVPFHTFPTTLDEQERALAENPLLPRLCMPPVALVPIGRNTTTSIRSQSMRIVGAIDYRSRTSIPSPKRALPFLARWRTLERCRLPAGQRYPATAPFGHVAQAAPGKPLADPFGTVRICS